MLDFISKRAADLERLKITDPKGCKQIETKFKVLELLISKFIHEPSNIEGMIEISKGLFTLPQKKELFFEGIEKIRKKFHRLKEIVELERNGINDGFKMLEDEFFTKKEEWISWNDHLYSP